MTNPQRSTPVSSRSLPAVRGLVLLSLVTACADVDDAADLEWQEAFAEELPADELLPPGVELPDGDEPEIRFVDETEQPSSDDEGELEPFGLTDHERDPETIATETATASGGVRRVTDYYLNPLYAETSWATPATESVSAPTGLGCSATMIGPNILVTAAHCGADAPSMTMMDVTGRVYRERDVTEQRTEQYTCNLLFHTFPETDLAVYHCPTTSSGVSLGDRFGWVDVDVSEPTLYGYIFSVFNNKIDNVPAAGDASLLTSGHIAQLEVPGVSANPTDNLGSVGYPYQGNTLARAVRMALWSMGGASGSGHFNSAGRMVVGPLSTGWEDGLNRWALSMRDFMTYGWIYTPLSSPSYCATPVTNCDTDNTINASYVTSLGLDPDDYTNTYVDQDSDWFFDLVSDIEDIEGENHKSMHHLRFDSRRQTRQWELGVGSAHQLNQGRVTYQSTVLANNAWVDLARHPGLNLSSAEPLDVTLNLDSTTGWYRVCLDGNTLSCSPFFFDNSNDGPTARRVTVNPPANVSKLVIQGWNASGSIHDVSVNEPVPHSTTYVLPQGWTAVERFANTFDSHDERRAWFEPEAPSWTVRPHILPDGQGTGVNWAGRITATNPSGTGFDYDLATHDLPFPQDGSGTLCFDHRRDPSTTWQGGTLGRLRVEHTDGTYVAGSYFIPGTNWSETCIQVDEPLATGEALRVMFGMYTYGTTLSTGTYFVDDVGVRFTD
ncbi:MAG: trypsin-like peptidase domain-containing protein [Myxococcota bacterium]